MRSASLYRMSGYSLILAALFWAIAVAMLPVGRANTVAELIQGIGPSSISAGLLGVVGCVLGIVAMIGIYRHFVGSEQEGWALLGAAAGVTGAIVNVAGMTIAAVGQPVLRGMANAAAQAATFEPAHAALWMATGSMLIVGGTLMWLGLIPLGRAMLRDPVWPRVVAWGAVVTGIVEAIGGFLLAGLGALPTLLAILGFAFLAWLGNTITRVPRFAAPAPGPAVRPGAAV